MGQKAMAMATPSAAQLAQMTPEQMQAFRWEREIDERFQDIYKGLLPCKLELTNIEEDLRNLKRRYRTPQECLEIEKTDTRQEKEERLKPMMDSYRANEDDVKHMVMDSVGRNYKVHIPLSVLDWTSLDDDFLINNDLILCKVR